MGGSRINAQRQARKVERQRSSTRQKSNLQQKTGGQEETPSHANCASDVADHTGRVTQVQRQRERFHLIAIATQNGVRER